MDKNTILERLKELGERLALDGIEAEMVIFGGAAISLVHDSRRITHDIDVSCSHKTDVVSKALQLCQERDLPTDWLNSAGDIFLSDDVPTVDFMDFPGLKLKVVAADYLLAMKLKSSRIGTNDFSDTKLLINKLGIRTRGDAESLIRKYFPAFKQGKNHQKNLEHAFMPLNPANSGKPPGPG
ncbi:MAG: hypothetical protein LBR80_14320 [Deltaproteobacteria bacterium]|jgi:predicted nucleotidyltransferase|nr:hypothetical protein [Deltaproteobacteria bacterium]